MTTANAQRIAQEPRQYVPGSHLRLVSSAPAQGQEARKMRENARAISLRTVARGHSAESTFCDAASKSGTITTRNL